MPEPWGNGREATSRLGPNDNPPEGGSEGYVTGSLRGSERGVRERVGVLVGWLGASERSNAADAIGCGQLPVGHRRSPEKQKRRDCIANIAAAIFDSLRLREQASFRLRVEGGYHMDDQVAALMALGVAVAVAISVHAPAQTTLPNFMALVEGIDISMHNEAAMYLVPEVPGPVSREDAKSRPGSARLRD
jgi:hypothetical protein